MNYILSIITPIKNRTKYADVIQKIIFSIICQCNFLMKIFRIINSTVNDSRYSIKKNIIDTFVEMLNCNNVKYFYISLIAYNLQIYKNPYPKTA